MGLLRSRLPGQDPVCVLLLGQQTGDGLDGVVQVLTAAEVTGRCPPVLQVCEGVFAGGSFCGDQLVDLLLRGRELLPPGLLVAGDDRRVAAVVATTAEVGEAEGGPRTPIRDVSDDPHSSLPPSTSTSTPPTTHA
ncbi:hypothetical protein, partial [Streptomyces hirsutus]|uniref:hypothetical protein n=1 Tax=Streptomyces hirsutus TaxID=35620 RepID=UPI003F4B87B6